MSMSLDGYVAAWRSPQPCAPSEDVAGAAGLTRAAAPGRPGRGLEWPWRAAGGCGHQRSPDGL